MSDTPNITLDSRIAPAKGVEFRDLGDVGVLVRQPGDHHFGLSLVGAAIWKLLADEATVSGLVKRLTHRFDVDQETCRAEVLAYLAQLAESRLIEVQTGE